MAVITVVTALVPLVMIAVVVLGRLGDAPRRNVLPA
jgi:hypothetical protein